MVEVSWMVAHGGTYKSPERSQKLDQCPSAQPHEDHGGLSIKRKYLSSILSSAVLALPLCGHFPL